MNAAEAIVKVLEEENVKHIFGHPGEQILPFYSALNDSDIKHILTRHEQGAIHSADGYARGSGDFGVCVATAGPGALNFTMGLAVSFKDSVPLLVITGDNPSSSCDKFQDIDIDSVFKPIVFKSFHPLDGKTSILNIKEAIDILKTEPKGPIHINLPKDVLLDEDIGIFDECFNDFIDVEVNYSHDFDYSQLNNLVSEIKKAKKPLILAGSGIFWGKAVSEFKQFVETNNIPYVHTYHAKSLLGDFPLDLGLVGIRGGKMANYSFNNSDLIIIFGSRLSERSIATGGDFFKDNNGFIDFKSSATKVIHVNIEKEVLSGDVNIHGDLAYVLKELNSLGKISDFDDSWLKEIHSYCEEYFIDDLVSENIPIKPQVAIDLILKRFKDNIIVNDAGSHTTWVNLLSEKYFNKLIFSGAMAPMGYGLPAACGASIAKPNEGIILINGDGGFQMNIQELATVSTYNLPILIVVLNNSQLGIIRQWEDQYYDNIRFEVDLENPDFVSIASAYGIDGETVSSKEELELAIDNFKFNNSLKLDKPYLIEVLVEEEDIPVLPTNI